jgi:hypothetical protein
MTVKKSEKKSSNQVLRVPKAKNKLGLAVPKITLPHDEFVKSPVESAADFNQLQDKSNTSQTSLTTLTSQPSKTPSSLFDINAQTSQSPLDNQSNFEALETAEQSALPSGSTSHRLSEPSFSPENNFLTLETSFNESSTKETEVINDFSVQPSNQLNNFTDPTSLTSVPSLTRHTAQTSHTSPPSYSSLKTDRLINSTTTTQSIAPERNFQRVPNSLVTVAIPAGLFRGKSKQLYDVLYQLTRGAVVPKRTVRIRKTELMKKSGIGARVTFDTNIAHLQSVGLVKETVFAGEHAGNEFEVFTIEELETMTTMTSHSSHSSLSGHSSLTSLTSSSQKQDSLDSLETSQTRQRLTADSTDAYTKFKTYFKDFDPVDDDSPLAAAFQLLKSAANRQTGKGLTRKDADSFRELIEILINETELAATRTKQVSSYLALGVENLKRRLYPKRETKKERGKNWQSVGKLEREIHSGSENVDPPIDIAALDENLRQTVLGSMRLMISQNGKEAIECFKSSYTQEDWDWLMNELKSEAGT